MSSNRRARLLQALQDLEADLGPVDPLDRHLDELLAELRPAPAAAPRAPGGVLELRQAAAKLPAERAA